MKYPRPISKLSGWPVLLAALLPLHPFATVGQNAPSLQRVSRDEADAKACKDHLNRIFEALEKYQAKHKRLPRWLSDLTSEFINDPKVFICPFVGRLGDLSSWRVGIRDGVFSDPILPTSYSYEFCAQELPLAPGVNPTHQEYKKRQMNIAGDRVPVVRCFAHDPVLNVSIGGHFYPSDRYWENEFPGVVNHDELSPEKVFHDLLTEFLKKPRTYPPRSADASARLLDLTAKYNFGLNETFSPTGGEGDFANLPQGVVTLDRVGMEFDIRGRIQLRRKKTYLPFPARVDGISVEQVCHRVHCLLGAINVTNSGTEIGSLEVRYADGQSDRIQIISGKPVQNWWFDPEKRRAEDAQIAWYGPSEFSQSRGKLQVRLYHLKWENPRPEHRISTLDFVSALTGAAPFLIAITLE